MIDPTAVRSLTDFQRNAKTHLTRLKKTGQPEVLTVNGRAAVVVQDAKSYERMMVRIARAEEVRAIREGVADLDAGRSRSWREARTEVLALGNRTRRRRSA